VEKCGCCGLWRVSGRLCLGCGDSPEQPATPAQQRRQRPWEARPIESGPIGTRTHLLPARDNVAARATVVASRGRLLSELRTLVAAT
jgi:hypothetical protein